MRVAVIGFGFAGLMGAANLIRSAQAPLTLYIIADDLSGLGVAYSTRNPKHLLNVPAAQMGAFPDDIGGFYSWLATSDAAQQKATLGITRNYAATDFAPRALYGAYLQSIWRDAQEIAAHKKMQIKLVPSRAVVVQAGEVPAVLTERGDAIAVDAIILATGHEVKPIMPQAQSANIIQNPWATDALKDAANWHSPVVLVGTGLTAIDMVLSLRTAGYKSDIIAASRHGWVPQPHAPQASLFAFGANDFAAHTTLQQLLQFVRQKMSGHGDWRAVVDAIRPHMQTLWQRLTTREQQRFLRWVLPVWNVHRHRMAPEIAAQIVAETEARTLRVVSSKQSEARIEDGELSIMMLMDCVQTYLRPSRVVNCTGPELNVARSSNPLIRQLHTDGIIEPHATGVGLATDNQHRAWGILHPKLHVIGSLMTGQLLESTAVPELRAQAAAVAANITRNVT